MSREYFVAGSQVNETTNSQFLADSLFQLNAAAAFNGSGSGSIDTVLLTAVSGTASFSNSSSGSVDTVSLTAPDASTSIGDTGIGSIDAIDLLAPSGTASFDNSSTGSIDTLSLSAPTATTSSDVSASGSIDEIILGEQDGTASFTSEASASIDAVSLTAPDAVGSSGDTGVGSIDLIDLTTIAATVSYSSSVSASIDAITLSAPTGTGSTGTIVNASGSIENINLSSVHAYTSELIVTLFPSFTLGTGTLTLDGCAIVGDIAYVTASSAKLFYIVDVSDKNALSIITTISTGTVSPKYITTDGDYIYLTGVIGASSTSELQQWDISTPTAPTLVNTVSSLPSSGDFPVFTDNNGYVYVLDQPLDHIIIYDSATLTQQSSTSCGANPNSGFVDGNTLYLTCVQIPALFQIWDVTNKIAPALVGSLSYGSVTGGNQVWIDGNYAYTCDVFHDIVVIDISTPSSPTLAYSHDVGSAQNYFDAYAIFGHYFIGINASGLFYWYNISIPTSPVFVGSVSLGTAHSTQRLFKGISPYYYALSIVSGTSRVIRPILFDFADFISGSGDIDSVDLGAIFAIFALYTDVSIDAVSLGEVSAIASTDAGVGIGYIDSISIGELTAVASPVFDISPTVISQYANSPIILALVTDMMIYLNANHQRNEFVRNIWDIRTANSQGLDIWGRIVGISRYLTLTNQDYFGFDPDFDPFNNSPFFAGNNVTNTFILSDEDYRRVILAKASANITNCTIPGIENTLSLLFGERGAIWVDVTGDHELTYVFNFVPTELELAIINAPKLIPRPAGFTIIYDYLT